MGAHALHHRLGEVAETLSSTERKTNQGRTKRFTRCRVIWDDGEGPEFTDLSADYTPGQRAAVIYRDTNYICDVNIESGQQSVIGDRVEGILALVLFISFPLSFILIGLPVYFGVRVWSRVTTDRLRKQVAAYVETLLPSIRAPRPTAPSPQLAGAGA
jgi:hypothetical protein